jgi:hypothetical protein
VSCFVSLVSSIRHSDRQEDVPIPKTIKLTKNCTYMNSDWVLRNLVPHEGWSIHEEERIAFEIKSSLVGAGSTGTD